MKSEIDRKKSAKARGANAASEMTMREAMAMAALQGLCAADGRNMGSDWCAVMAVQMADRVMLSLEEKTP